MTNKFMYCAVSKQTINEYMYMPAAAIYNDYVSFSSDSIKMADYHKLQTIPCPILTLPFVS